jgi:hypothetical protein
VSNPLILLIGGLAWTGLMIFAHLKQADSEDDGELERINLGFQKFIYIGIGVLASVMGGLLLINQSGVIR